MQHSFDPPEALFDVLRYLLGRQQRLHLNKLDQTVNEEEVCAIPVWLVVFYRVDIIRKAWHHFLSRK